MLIKHTKTSSLMKNTITQETILKRNPEQLFSIIDGEVVMLSIKNGEYYNLDYVGSNIWEFLEKPCSFENLIGKLMDNYEVNKETCISDTLAFIEESIEKKIIEIIRD